MTAWALTEGPSGMGIGQKQLWAWADARDRGKQRLGRYTWVSISVPAGLHVELLYHRPHSHWEVKCHDARNLSFLNRLLLRQQVGALYLRFPPRLTLQLPVASPQASIRR